MSGHPPLYDKLSESTRALLREMFYPGAVQIDASERVMGDLSERQLASHRRICIPAERPLLDLLRLARGGRDPDAGSTP